MSCQQSLLRLQPDPSSRARSPLAFNEASAASAAPGAGRFQAFGRSERAGALTSPASQASRASAGPISGALNKQRDLSLLSASGPLMVWTQLRSESRRGLKVAAPHPLEALARLSKAASCSALIGRYSEAAVGGSGSSIAPGPPARCRSEASATG